MDFAIIAAGEGSRLRAEGVQSSKPMVELQGLPLVHRLIDIFIRNKAEQIVIIINEYSKDVDDYLSHFDIPVPLKIIRKNTQSSLHSFYELLPHVKTEKLCLTTVDTIFDEEEFALYVDSFSKSSAVDGLMAVTSFIDDETPLYVKTDSEMNITAYEDSNNNAVYVSGGIYCLTKPAFSVVEKAVNNGVERMRNFQRLLISEGLHIKAHSFSKIIDIDHASDIAVAEEWLANKAVNN
jgi:NDP-sugar pyrophosphorylase family protein